MRSRNRHSGNPAATNASESRATRSCEERAFQASRMSHSTKGLSSSGSGSRGWSAISSSSAYHASIEFQSKAT